MKGITNATEEFNENFKSLEQLVNYTMLYDYGDECINITGGWENTLSQERGSYTENASNVYMTTYKNSAAGKYCHGTVNKINVMDYTKLYSYLSYTACSSPAQSTCRVGIGSIKKYFHGIRGLRNDCMCE